MSAASSGSSRHFAAQRNLVAIGQSGLSQTARAADLQVHGLKRQYSCQPQADENRRPFSLSAKLAIKNYCRKKSKEYSSIEYRSIYKTAFVFMSVNNPMRSSRFDVSRLNRAPSCGAKSKRSGERCRGPAVRGKRVCRMHGGAGGGAPKAAEMAILSTVL